MNKDKNMKTLKDKVLLEEILLHEMEANENNAVVLRNEIKFPKKKSSCCGNFLAMIIFIAIIVSLAGLYYWRTKFFGVLVEKPESLIVQDDHRLTTMIIETTTKKIETTTQIETTTTTEPTTTTTRKWSYVFITQPIKPNISLNHGENITLMCNCSGNPTPNITWEFEKEIIQQMDDRRFILMDASLKIFNTSDEDQGIYTCTASNGIDLPFKIKYNLTVKQASPDQPFINCTIAKNCKSNQVCALYNDLGHRRCECPAGMHYDAEYGQCKSKYSHDFILFSNSSNELYTIPLSIIKTDEPPTLLKTQIKEFIVEGNETKMHYSTDKFFIDCSNQDLYILTSSNSKPNEAKIYQMDFANNRYSPKPKLINDLLDKPKTISIDWVSGNIFWLLRGNNEIKVTNLKNKKTFSIGEDGEYWYQEIAVHPLQGKIFLLLRTRIDWCNQDGSDYETFLNIQKKNHSTADLKINFLLNQICWTSIGLHKIIYCADIETKSITIIAAELDIQSVVVHLNNNYLLYITNIHDKNSANAETKSVQSLFRYNIQKKIHEKLMEINNYSLSHPMIVVPQHCPPVTNDCGYKNGGCKEMQICLMKGQDNLACVTPKLSE